MSESIKGSKSFLYSIEEVPGVDNSKDSMQHLSIQEIAGKRGAADVMIHGVTTVSTAHVVGAGSSRKKIVSAGSSAKQGYFIRMTSGNSINEEIAIVKVIDANGFVISALFDIALGDTFDILRSVTPSYTASGDLNVVVAGASPIQFVRDGVDTEVLENTATPVNNRALPSKIFIQKDGVTLPVNKDTGVPANTVAIPVEIVSASGTNINITAGDINIQTTSEGASFDSMRIGNGSGRYAAINLSSEVTVHDEDLKVAAAASLAALNTLSLQTTQLLIKTAIDSIDTKTPALGQAISAASTPVVLPATQITALTPPAAITGFGLETTQQSVKTAVESLNTKAPSLGQALAAASVPVVLTAAQVTALTPPAAITGFSLEATQLLVKAKTDNLDVALSTVAKDATLLASNVLIGAVAETAPATDIASSGINGRLQRIAQRITSLIAQLPATLGIKTAANSLSIAPASDAVFQTSSTTSGAITSTQKSMPTANTAVRATVSGSALASNKKRKIKPASSNTGRMWYGSSSVTIANGVEIMGPDYVTLDGDFSDYYVVSDTNTQILEIIEVA